jgi:hypothetical protein
MIRDSLVSASGARTASLSYDPLGRLWQTSGGTAGTTRFLYDGDRLVIEYDGSGGKGLAARGVRPTPGSRTFDGQIREVTQRAGGNPTVQRNARDLVRLRPGPAHGRPGPSATPQNVRNINPNTKQEFRGPGPDRNVSNRDMRELHKARDGQSGSSCRTKSRSCTNIGY